MSRVEGTVRSSRARTRAFRIVAGFLGVIAFVPSAVFVLGSYTVESQDIDLVHNISGLAGFGMVFGAAGIAMAVRAEDSGAAFRAVAVSAVLTLGAGLLAGDVVTGFWFVGIVFAVALYLLHPDRGDTTRVRPTSTPLLASGVVALIVAVAYGVDQAALQRNGTPALDPHAELHHYSGMAVMGLLLAAGALATATGGGGPRAIGWATGIGAALYGAASLAYPDHLGTVDTPWAVLTLLWGLALVTLTELEMRRPPTTREPG